MCMLAGADVARLLRTGDHVERAVLARAARRALEVREIEQQKLAVRIATEIGRLFGG